MSIYKKGIKREEEKIKVKISYQTLLTKFLMKDKKNEENKFMMSRENYEK
ncbi:MAG: hypothetical protein QXF82_01235 [Nitrososphaeria archaeon]